MTRARRRSSLLQVERPRSRAPSSRKRRLIRSLLLGALAVGVPAVANAIIARRSRRLERPAWGRPRRFAWARGDVAFQVLGSGAPVVLLHDFGPGHDAEQWRAAGELIACNRRVFAPDLLGWGRSDMPDIRYDNELYLRLLEDFVDQVVGEPCTVVAAGLSAAYAAQLGVDRPDLVQALALVAPRGLADSEEEPRLADALTNRALRLPVFGTAGINLLTSRGALARHLRRDVYHRSERVSSAILEHYYHSSHQPGAHHAIAAYLSGYLNHDIGAALPRIACPTLLAWGRHAAAPGVEAADLWLSRIEHARLEVFGDCRSLPHSERPQAFARRLEAFLDRAAA